MTNVLSQFVGLSQFLPRCQRIDQSHSQLSKQMAHQTHCIVLSPPRKCSLPQFKLARALIKDPDFIHRISEWSLKRSACDTCNHCIAVMYNGPYVRIKNQNG